MPSTLLSLMGVSAKVITDTTSPVSDDYTILKNSSKWTLKTVILDHQFERSFGMQNYNPS